MLDNDFEFYDEIPSINEFKKSINNYKSNLKKYIEEKIRKRENLEKFNNLKISIKEFNQIKNYYIDLNNNIETLENKAQERYTVIYNIYNDLLKEYKSNSDFYTEEKEEAINKILTLLQELRIATAKERDEVIQKNKVINVVIGVFSEINNEIKSDRTSQENENKDMVNEIRDFAVNIKKYLINQNKEIEFPVFPSAIEGISVKSKYGFKFIKEAKYSNANLERALYKELFVQNYQSKEKIMNVNSREEFINAVKGSTLFKNLLLSILEKKQELRTKMEQMKLGQHLVK